MLNDQTVTLEIKRIDLCNLLLACTHLDIETDENTKKWRRLHDELKEVLDAFDKEHGF